MLCNYGCGKESAFILKNGKHCCSKRPAGCPEIKKLNSAGCKKSYTTRKRVKIDYAGFPQETKDKMAWSRGLTIVDPRIKANSNANKGNPKGKHLKPMSDLGRDNISKGRSKTILEGRYDTSGRKGHRGHYDGVYFHSSWELAFYVYNKENTTSKIVRNTKTIITYVYDGRPRRYIPDFIVDGKLVEIKSYLHGDRDNIKFEQTKDLVEYKFGENLQVEFNYCKQKYGIKFWEKLYAQVAQ
jgi:hypothetical protein